MTSDQSDKNELKSPLLEDERHITDDTVLMHSKSAEYTKEHLDVLDFLGNKRFPKTKTIATMPLVKESIVSCQTKRFT